MDFSDGNNENNQPNFFPVFFFFFCFAPAQKMHQSGFVEVYLLLSFSPSTVKTAQSYLFADKSVFVVVHVSSVPSSDHWGATKHRETSRRAQLKLKYFLTEIQKK